MLPTVARQVSQSTKDAVAKAAFSAITANPYRAKKVWPPDFTKLPPQQQLRFEKKYKRRLKLAGQSPRWDKFLRYTQLIAITGTLVYMVFFTEYEWWGRKYNPQEELAAKAHTLFGTMDPDKRYERSIDAPPPPDEQSKSK